MNQYRKQQTVVTILTKTENTLLVGEGISSTILLLSQSNQELVSILQSLKDIHGITQKDKYHNQNLGIRSSHFMNLRNSLKHSYNKPINSPAMALVQTEGNPDCLPPDIDHR